MGVRAPLQQTGLNSHRRPIHGSIARLSLKCNCSTSSVDRRSDTCPRSSEVPSGMPAPLAGQEGIAQLHQVRGQLTSGLACEVGAALSLKCTCSTSSPCKQDCRSDQRSGTCPRSSEVPSGMPALLAGVGGNLAGLASIKDD